MSYLLPIILQMRPHQWIKNSLIVLPLIFSNNLRQTAELNRTLLAVVLFSLLASSVYIMNDLFDLPNDKLHPQKKNRPLASGQLSTGIAWALFAVLLIFSLTGSYYWLGQIVSGFFVVYFLVGIIYSLYFKHIPPLDIIIVALFYLVRPAVGAVTIGVPVSSWLIVTTFFAALYLVSLKRLSELISIRSGRAETRRNIAHYTPALLQNIGMITLAITIVSYAIYASGFPRFFVLTIIPVVALALRLMMLNEHYPMKFESPERAVLSDPIALTSLLGWVIWVVIYHR